jgi:glycine cleavage system H protein
VLARNDALESQPELLNSDPYGEGWIVEIEVGDIGVVNSLLDADAYRELVEDS